MYLYLFILIICLFIFLFVVYRMSKEDVLFIKKNITLESVFNCAFLTVITGLIFSRFIFLLSQISSTGFNPLSFFFIVPDFGLSLVGGVIGGFLFTLLYTKRKKLPTGRVIDYFSYALFCTFPLGYAGSFFLTGKLYYFYHIYLPFIYLGLLILFRLFLYPRILRGDTGNGMAGSLILLIFSFITVVSHFAQDQKGIVSFLNVEDFLSLGLILGVFLFLIRNERRIK